MATQRRVRRTLRPAVHRTILVVDVEGFGDPSRSNRDQVAIRDGLYFALRKAFQIAGIRWSDCYHEDRGDGVFVLIPAEVPKAVLVESIPEALVRALQDYNKGRRMEQRMRLRLALHAGEVIYDDHGVTAAAITLAFRLTNARPLRVALAESPGVLALIVSSWFFEEVVRNSAVNGPANYCPVRVTVKETRTKGWIHVPDVSDVRRARRRIVA